jgi:hypothetical protein
MGKSVFQAVGGMGTGIVKVRKILAFDILERHVGLGLVEEV